MSRKLAAMSTLIVLAATLPIASPGNAQGSPQQGSVQQGSPQQGSPQAAAPFHRGNWPISQGHNYQPRRDQLDARHESDVSAQEARELDRLYEELQNPSWLAKRPAAVPCRRQRHRRC